MIPAFEANGYLPPGIHRATLDEIEARFGTESELRRAQFESLAWLIELVRLEKDRPFSRQRRTQATKDRHYDRRRGPHAIWRPWQHKATEKRRRVPVLVGISGSFATASVYRATVWVEAGDGMIPGRLDRLRWINASRSSG